MSQPAPSDSPHRRDFVRAIAVAGTGATVAATAALADDPKPQTKKEAPAAEEKPKTETDPIAAEIEARYQLVLARFGKHKQLDEKAKATIKADVASLVHRAEALRKIPVDNGVGPFPVFHPYRAPLA